MPYALGIIKAIWKKITRTFPFTITERHGMRSVRLRKAVESLYAANVNTEMAAATSRAMDAGECAVASLQAMHLLPWMK